jgi:hypothetical protein
LGSVKILTGGEQKASGPAPAGQKQKEKTLPNILLHAFYDQTSSAFEAAV